MSFKVRISSDETEIRWFGMPLKQRASVPAYLNNFDAGRAPTPESSFYDNKSRQGVLNVGLDTLRTWNSIPRLRKYEESRVSKYGPQGFIYPMGSTEMWDALSVYYDRCHEPCKIHPEVERQLIKFYSGAELTPLTAEAVIQRALDKTGLSTNSGAPLFTKRRKVIPESIALSKELDATMKFDYPAIIGARSTKNKMRLIFMAPFAQNINELRYVYALMDWLLEVHSGVSAWMGQPAVEEIIGKAYRPQGTTCISTDFTKMDTSMGPAQLNLVYRLTSCAFKPQYRETWKQILMQSVTQPVIIGSLTQPGTLTSRKAQHAAYLTGTHGILSGLGFTNLAETVINDSIHWELSHMGYSLLLHQVNGDDGEAIVDGTPRRNSHIAEDFCSIARRRGLVSNPDKQFVSEDEIRYLQRVYSPETVVSGKLLGAYPMILALNSAKNPERDSNLTGMERAVRLIEICENTYHHPRFHDIVDVFARGSEDIRKMITDPAVMEAMEAIYRQRVSGGSQSTSIARERTSLLEFDTVKYLQRSMNANHTFKETGGR